MHLHAAAARGDLNGISYALDHGTPVDARNSAGETALIFALATARTFDRRQGPKVTPETVSLLLDAGASLDEADALDQTPVHHAVQISAPAFVDLLLARKDDFFRETKSGYSVMLHACCQPASTSKIQIIDRLAAMGLDLNKASRYSEFPLGVCLYFGDFASLNRLHQLGADLSPLQWTDLHIALAFGQLADVKALAASPSAINAKEKASHELSPWLLSICQGDLGKITLLAELGADLTQTGRCGLSPLHLAAKCGRVDVIGWLLDYGANVQAESDFGEIPLHEAVEWDHSESVAALIRASSPSQQNNVLDQPIHKAVSLSSLQLLVEEGRADVNAISGTGDWPLKAAAEANDTARIAWLLNRGAEVDRTSTGETALHAAVRWDSRESAKLLLDAGANSNAQDVDGCTPLMEAKSRETIWMLLDAGAQPAITDQAGWGTEYWIKDPILQAALKGK